MHRTVRGRVTLLLVWSTAVAQIGAPHLLAQQTSGTASIRVPDVQGLSAQRAKQAVEAAGLAAEFHLGSAPARSEDALKVYAVEPQAGTRLRPRSIVSMTIYSQAEPTAKMPASSDPGAQLSSVLLSHWTAPGEEKVDPRSGQLVLHTTDLTVPAGVVTLTLQRHLCSSSNHTGLLGPGWQLNWEKQIVRQDKTALVLEDGLATVFSVTENAREYRSAAGDKLLFDNSSAVRVLADGTRERYDAQGRLVEHDLNNGNAFKLIYDQRGRLQRVTGPFDTFLAFDTDESGRLSQAISSSGLRATYLDGDQKSREAAANELLLCYDYDGRGRVTLVNHPPRGLVQLSYDGQDRVIRRRWADGASEQFEYDATAGTVRHTDPLGRVSISAITDNGRRVTLQSPAGHRTVIQMDEQGRPTKITGPTGLVGQFHYDALGRGIAVNGPLTGPIRLEYQQDSRRLAAVIGPTGRRQEYEHDAQGNLRAVTVAGRKAKELGLEYSPRGQIVKCTTRTAAAQEFLYHADGSLQTITNAAGGREEYEYDSQGKLLKYIDAVGGTTHYTYDDQDRLASRSDPAGGTVHYQYSAAALVSQSTDSAGAVTRYEYDSRGRLVGETDPLGRSRHHEYDAAGQLIAVRSAGGSVVRHRYDAEGNRIAEENALGGVTVRQFDALGRITKEENAAGNVTDYEYSAAGRVTKQMQADGRVTEFSYDDLGQLLSETDPWGRTTHYAYDERGNLTNTRLPGGRQIENKYDGADRLIEVLADGTRQVTYKYDALGNCTEARFAAGLELSYRYDAVGHLVAWQDSSGAAQEITYDPVGRPCTVRDGKRQTARFDYDAVGNLVGVANGLGQLQRCRYDAAGQLIEVTAPAGGSVRYGYDHAGNLADVRHPGGGQSHIRYDALGNPIDVTDPLGNTTSSVYDRAGRLVAHTDANGRTTNFTYDGTGRLAQKKLGDGTVVAYRYDRLGDLVEVDDGQFPVRYDYDDQGRRTGIEYPAIGRKLCYEYDSQDRLAKFSDSEGHTTGYQYDALGRLVALHPSDDQSITFTYDAKGRRTSLRYPNGVEGTWQYDASDRVVRQQYRAAGGEVISGWQYRYDAAGNLAETMDESGQLTTYRYDANGQLVASRQGREPLVEYTYQPGGRRATRQTGDNATQYRYNQADQLVAAGGESYRYDANGNLVERRGPKGVTRYEYDTEDQLVQVKLPGGKTIRYGYAATGARIWREDDGRRTWFVTDGADVWAELDEDLRPQAAYLHGPGVDEPLRVARKDQRLYLHADRLGSVRRVTDRRAELTASYDYDAFGRRSVVEGQATSPFAFTGREYDEAVGLYYYRARYYDAAAGRFLTRDPAAPSLDQPLEWNPYQYALNCPTRYVDPAGTNPEMNPVKWAKEMLNQGYSPDRIISGLKNERLLLDSWLKSQEQLNVRGRSGRGSVPPIEDARGIHRSRAASIDRAIQVARGGGELPPSVKIPIQQPQPPADATGRIRADTRQVKVTPAPAKPASGPPGGVRPAGTKGKMPPVRGAYHVSSPVSPTFRPGPGRLVRVVAPLGTALEVGLTGRDIYTHWNQPSLGRVMSTRAGGWAGGAGAAGGTGLALLGLGSGPIGWVGLAGIAAAGAAGGYFGGQAAGNAHDWLVNWLAPPTPQPQPPPSTRTPLAVTNQQPMTDPSLGAVPPVVGLHAAEAVRRIKAAGYESAPIAGKETKKQSGHLQVYEQSPLAGTPMARGGTVSFTFWQYLIDARAKPDEEEPPPPDQTAQTPPEPEEPEEDEEAEFVPVRLKPGAYRGFIDTGVGFQNCAYWIDAGKKPYPAIPVVISFSDSGNITGRGKWQLTRAETAPKSFEGWTSIDSTTTFDIQGVVDWETGKMELRLINGRDNELLVNDDRDRDPPWFYRTGNDAEFEYTLVGWQMGDPRLSGLLNAFKGSDEPTSIVHHWFVKGSDGTNRWKEFGWTGAPYPDEASGGSSRLQLKKWTYWTEANGEREEKDQTAHFQRAWGHVHGWFLAIRGPADEEEAEREDQGDRALVGFGVFPQSVTVVPGQKFTLRAEGVYGDAVHRTQDITGKATWRKSGAIKFIGPGSFEAPQKKGTYYVRAGVRRDDGNWMTDTVKVIVK